MAVKTVTCEVYGGGTREVPASELKFRPSAYGLIERGDRLLLIKMPNGKYFLPGGGVVEGETLSQAVERETMEESGVAVQAISPPYRMTEVFFCYGQEAWHIHAFCLCCRLLSDRPPTGWRALEPEIEGRAVWVPSYEISSLPMRPISLQAIEHYYLLKRRGLLGIVTGY